MCNKLSWLIGKVWRCVPRCFQDKHHDAAHEIIETIRWVAALDSAPTHTEWVRSVSHDEFVFSSVGCARRSQTSNWQWKTTCLLTMIPRGKPVIPLESRNSIYPMRTAEMFQQRQHDMLSSVIMRFLERSRKKKVWLLQIIGTNLTPRLSQSFESMQRLCDKYNRAIDSIHQLVSGFISAREFHVNTNYEQDCHHSWLQHFFRFRL